jgi:YHS domain-containing protein
MNSHPEPTAAPERDPVCGMNVRVDAALEDGLVVEHEAHTYHFFRESCRDAFVAAPRQYITSHRHAAEAAPAGAPHIDEGMRLSYDSCSCCLSDAYPDVKAALDAERAATAQPEATWQRPNRRSPRQAMPAQPTLASPPRAAGAAGGAAAR